MRALLFFAVLLASTVFAQGNPELTRANRLLFDSRYAEAAKALEAASRTNANSREVVLRIYELQGIVFGQLNQTTKSREAFQAMLALDPKRTLNGKFNSKVNQAFAAATDWLSNNPPLDFKPAKAALSPKGSVMQLAAKLKSDALKLGRKVRFHVHPDEARWSEQDAALQGAYAAADIEAPGIEWWAELLGDNDRVLAVIGSDKNPIREGAAATRAPPVVAPTPKDAPRKDEAQKTAGPSTVEPGGATIDGAPLKPDLRSAVPKRSGPLRPIGIAMLSAGLAAVGVGAYFGVRNQETVDQITNARSFAGVVTGITQRSAYQLKGLAREEAMIANTLFIAGGAVAAIGGVLVFVGGRSSPAVSLQITPTLGGVLVGGGF